MQKLTKIQAVNAEAEGQAEAILRLAEAQAEGIRRINEANPNSGLFNSYKDSKL